MAEKKGKGTWATIAWPPAGGPWAPVLTTSNLPTFRPIGPQRSTPYDAEAFGAQWAKRQKELEFPAPCPSSDPIVISSDDDGDVRRLPAPTMPADPPPKVTLSPEQQKVVDLAAQGHNIFYTGSAGCGKSTVLHAIKQRLRDLGKTVHVVAPTGMAALAIGGATIWGYVGWSPDSLKKTLMALQKIPLNNRDPRVKNRLQHTDVLIIDEISMIENLFFQRLSEVMRYVRSHTDGDDSNELFSGHSISDKPFGGAQIIVTGDFCQLPPIKPFKNCLCGYDFIRCRKTGAYSCSNKNTAKNVCHFEETYNESDKWAFQSTAWADCNFKHILLKTIHRQNDTRFVNILQHCRTGRPISQEDIDLLMAPRPVPQDAVRLFPRRIEVAELNRKQFALLPDAPRPYPCLDTFRPSENVTDNDIKDNTARKKLDTLPLLANAPVRTPLWALRDHRFDELVSLKTGMLVVLLTNLDLDAGLCNGSQGVIVGFRPFSAADLPKRNSTKSLPGVQQLTGEHAGLKEALLLAFSHQAQAYHDFAKTPVPLGWPIVRFHGHSDTRTIYPECQVGDVGDESPYSALCRTQVPLAPAWALSVHKAQGMTLDRVVVNLQSAFEEGQVYVALSRARTLEGLKVEGRIADLRSGLKVNEEVQEFLEERFGGVPSQEEEKGEGGGKQVSKSTRWPWEDMDEGEDYRRVALMENCGYC